MSISIQKEVPLAPYTTFKLGGPAKYFVEVSTEEALLEAVSYAQKNNLEVFVLAGGSNVVISDAGFSGLVIKLKVKSEKLKVIIQSPKFLVECWAGESFSSLLGFCMENSLAGFEWAAGIPGAVGGAVRGNAGAYGGEIKDSIESVRVFDISKNIFENYKPEECNFSYRNSIFKENKNLIVLGVKLKLAKGDKKEIEAKMKEVVSKRNEKLPCDASAGSFFQNPSVENPEIIAKFERDAQCKSRGGKVPAGWVIEELGLRGKKMGGVMVSEKHANFVVNLGKGTAQEVVMLSSFIKQQARSKMGVKLKEEVQYVGF